MNKSITNFHWISNSIEILLVGMVSGDRLNVKMYSCQYRDPHVNSLRPSDAYMRQ